jgi:gp16 family phage-associated protein
MNTGKIRTTEEARAAIEATGKSISQWAREHDLDPPRVHDLLLRRGKGVRGASHKAAVLLGIKQTLINAGKAKDIKIDSSLSLRYGSE